MSENGSSQVWLSYAKAFAMVVIAIPAGLCFGSVLHGRFSWSETSIVVFRCIAVGLLATSALGRLGWTIQTWGGKSPAESSNLWIFRILYLVGLASTVASFCLKPA
jgi:hypothetical protein